MERPVSCRSSYRYSSLAYLRELPVPALKIDRAFIADLLDEPCSEAIARPMPVDAMLRWLRAQVAVD